jgi:predicted DNA-binding protein
VSEEEWAKGSKKEMEVIKIRLPKGTYARLKETALKLGSSRSVMVRMAIMEMIRKGALYK